MSLITEKKLIVRVHGEPHLPTLIYLPGLHGDCTLLTAFRAALAGKVRLVEMTYPRSLTWTVDDYGDAILAELAALNISRGWLLGESFGSQVAWSLIGKCMPRDHKLVTDQFCVDGLVLAGGFVKHPWPWGPGALRKLGGIKSMSALRLMMKLYSKYSRFRQKRIPGSKESGEQFRARRTKEDGQAMGHRLALLDHYDPRPIAQATKVSVYYLGGMIDPLIPWVLVRHWLGRNCPGYRGGKTFWWGDHAVLATNPNGAARWIIHWMNAAAQPSAVA